MNSLNKILRILSGANHPTIPAAKAVMEAVKRCLRARQTKPAITQQVGAPLPRPAKLGKREAPSEPTVAKTASAPPPQPAEPESREPSRAQWQHVVERAAERIANKESDAAPDYPIDALGDLTEVVKIVASQAQLEQALPAQAFLAAASLLTAAVYKVESLTGPKPLNLYFLTEASSGDGKTTGENIALAPVISWEKANPDRRLLLRDGTVPAILRDLGKVEYGVLGFMSSEGGVFFGGYSFKGENKLSTGATLNALWDSGELSYSRVTSGENVHLYDRHLVMSLAAQPRATGAIICDQLLADVGFLPRLLYAIPPESKPRLGRAFNLATNEFMLAYCARAASLLSLLSEEREMQVLSLEPDAREFLVRAFERYEYEAKRGSMQHIRPFAIRATEQLCRLSGVLAAWGGRPSVCLRDVSSAKQLVDYSLACWSHALVTAPDAMKDEAALRIVTYMAEHGGTMSDKLNLGPEPRKAEGRRAALDLLMHLGLVRQVGRRFELIP